MCEGPVLLNVFRFCWSYIELSHVMPHSICLCSFTRSIALLYAKFEDWNVKVVAINFKCSFCSKRKENVYERKSSTFKGR